MKTEFSQPIRVNSPAFPFLIISILVGLPCATLCQEIQPQELYRQLYQAALADSVISPDEEAMLRTLEQALGLHEELVEEALGESLAPRPPGLDQSGRWTLVAQNMGWGAGIYGWGIPYLLDLEEKWYVGGVMFSLGTSFYLTWKYTADMDLPEARSQLQRYGGAVGLQFGRVLNSILGYWDNDEGLERGEVLVLMGTVPAGMYLGDRLYRKWQPSTGQAYALSLYGELGSSFLRLAHLEVAPEPKKYEEYKVGEWYWEERETVSHLNWRKQRILFKAAGYPLGTYLGHRLYGDRRYSFGDAVLLAFGRYTGALYGILLANLFEMDFDDPHTGWRWMMTAGSVGGIGAMDRYIKGSDYTFGQAALMGLGSVAGGAFVFGLGVILEIHEHQFYETGVIAGSLGGFLLTRRIVEPVSELAAAAKSSRQPRISFALQPVSGEGIIPILSIEARW